MLEEGGQGLLGSRVPELPGEPASRVTRGQGPPPCPKDEPSPIGSGQAS